MTTEFTRLALATLLLAGCATAAPPAPAPAPTPADEQRAARLQRLAAIDDWAVNFRAAVNDAGHGWQASGRWRQSREGYRIELFGPFGQGRVLLSGGPDGAELRAGEQRYRAADPEQLLRRHAGRRLPLAGLVYWIRGLPDPGQPAALSYDARGRLARIRQQGWLIEYPAYGSASGHELPTKIRARRDGLKVTLAVQTWTLPGAS